MQETEQQLLDAIHDGDREALRRLYDRYSDYAMAIGLRYVYNREDARDVVQDCFVKILTRLDMVSESIRKDLFSADLLRVILSPLTPVSSRLNVNHSGIETVYLVYATGRVPCAYQVSISQ